MGRYSIGALLVCAFAVAFPAGALGCSCAGSDIRERFEASDAALAGRLVSRSGSRYTFRVEDDFKHNLPRRVTLPTYRYTSCELAVHHVGDRIGLFLRRKKDGSWWPVGTCNEFSPGELRARLRGLPRPRGRAPVRFVAGGFRGTRSRVLAFDGRGRVVAYGYGRGTAEAVAVCPGARRLLEVYSRGDGHRIAVRRLDTMRVEDDRGLVLEGDPGFVSELECRSGGGREALLFATDYESPPSRLYRVVRGHATIAHRGQAHSVALAPTVAYLDKQGKELLAVDLEDGSAQTLVRGLNGLIGLSVSPDGKYLAGVTDGQSMPDRDLDESPDRTAVHAFDLRSSPVAYTSATIGTSGEHSATVWLDSARFVSYPLCCGDTGRLFGSDGGQLQAFAWDVGDGAVFGGELFGAYGDAFYRAQPVAGSSRRVRTLFGDLSTPLEPVPRAAGACPYID